MSEKESGPRVVAFVCNWCTYVGADGAGTARLQYRPEVIPIRLQCTGRIDPLFIVTALETGADGVIVSGCHPGDCHYVAGNFYARRRFTIFRSLLDFLGVDIRRIQFAWVSATEGAKWTELVNEHVKRLEELGSPQPLKDLGEISTFERRSVKELIPESTPVAGAIDYSAVSAAVKTLARDLLEKKEVGIVVGYGDAGVRGVATPTFATTADDAARLVFTERSLNNLSAYLVRDLVRKHGKIGIVAKGCDVKAIAGLIQENQIEREDVKIIGVVCQGVKDDRGRLMRKCFACDVKIPHLYDVLAGQAGEPSSPTPRVALAEATVAELEALENMSLDERWKWWQDQFSRCIKCYACRAVCPFCYCDRCIVERTRPQWIPSSAHGKGIFSWMVTRAFHLAGRCVQCDECTRVCPAGIRLDLINAKLALEVEKAYGYAAGYKHDAIPPLQTFKKDDEEDFIK